MDMSQRTLGVVSMSFRGADKSNILNSTLALRIIGNLAHEESYPAEIAKKLNISVGVLNDYIRALEKSKIIGKTKRTQAQYYGITWDGMAKLWLDVWSSIIDSQLQQHENMNKQKIQKLLYSIGENRFFPDFLKSLFNYARFPQTITEKDNLGRVLSEIFQKTLVAFFEDELTRPENKALNASQLNDGELTQLRDNLKDLYSIRKYLTYELYSDMAAESWIYMATEINKQAAQTKRK